MILTAWARCDLVGPASLNNRVRITPNMDDVDHNRDGQIVIGSCLHSGVCSVLASPTDLSG